MPTWPESNENNRKLAQILSGEATNMYIGLIIINFEQLKCLSLCAQEQEQEEEEREEPRQS